MEVGERWLLSKEVGGSISFRRSGGDSLLMDRQGFQLSHKNEDNSCIWFLQGGRRAKRWGKGGISLEGRREGVFSSSGKGYMVVWLDVVKIYLTGKRTCKEVGGWSFSSLKEGVAGVGRGVSPTYLKVVLCSAL